MRPIKVLLTGAVFLSMVLPALAKDQFICIASKSTGFSWDGVSWAIRNFQVGDDKFLVNEVPPKVDSISGKYNFEVKRFGHDEFVFHCARHDIGEVKGARIVCGGLGYGMLIDTQTLRYHEFYGLGYIDGKDEKGNTPNITIGTCSRIN